ncbi:hypothetical protein GXP71_12470 [Cellulomonas sp. H30R-01]|uniref:hypothetical protein n=1 Tax=Cellulomonas sp. H30R-01 TaxID=2704467 RepID=UPI00138C114A|nr:hypothetical protein [Cellulomonas sp. H30R-01]QHT56809.1 hypothetical protein GXP71_12470 [Cellulomonas sp. H30R-01]
MTDTDVQRTDADERLVAELAGASWFQVAAVTARAHHEIERCPAGAERRDAQERYEVLRRLLDARTDDLASHPVFGGTHRTGR